MHSQKPMTTTNPTPLAKHYDQIMTALDLRKCPRCHHSRKWTQPPFCNAQCLDRWVSQGPLPNTTRSDDPDTSRTRLEAFLRALGNHRNDLLDAHKRTRDQLRRSRAHNATLRLRTNTREPEPEDTDQPIARWEFDQLLRQKEELQETVAIATHAARAAETQRDALRERVEELLARVETLEAQRSSTGIPAARLFGTSTGDRDARTAVRRVLSVTHPDVHAGNPDRVAEANRLTTLLLDASRSLR